MSISCLLDARQLSELLSSICDEERTRETISFVDKDISNLNTHRQSSWLTSRHCASFFSYFVFFLSLSLSLALFFLIDRSIDGDDEDTEGEIWNYLPSTQIQWSKTERKKEDEINSTVVFLVRTSSIPFVLFAETSDTHERTYGHRTTGHDLIMIWFVRRSFSPLVLSRKWIFQIHR